jgi:16S rRNA (cytosine1402-N4)-methyltransferase
MAGVSRTTRCTGKQNSLLTKEEGMIHDTHHVPVLLHEVLSLLQPRAGGHYIDGTLGAGGHTAALLEHSVPDGKVLGIDTDTQALGRVRARLSSFVESDRLLLAHGNFAELASIVEKLGFAPVHGIVLDLGFSSDQIEDAQRGFSFSIDGPLDMRLDQSLALSAADLVNTAGEQELADIFWRYGEERRSRQIAHRIVRERAKKPIQRTTQLAALATVGVAYKPGSIHPATRIFQALRIAVNKELEHLESVLPQTLDVLSRPAEEGNRIVVISFHSLEDRIVKEFMRREGRDCVCPPHLPICMCGHKARLRILTPKPLKPSIQEIESNPRARSAKLRAAEVLVSS